jgi:hypothetical protein
MDFDGSIICADKILEDAHQIATNYAIQQILKDIFIESISPLTRFYILWR